MADALDLRQSHRTQLNVALGVPLRHAEASIKSAKVSAASEELKEDPEASREEEDQVEAVEEKEKPDVQAWRAELLNLQPEFVPPHGSIYTRSLTPGPGHYALGVDWDHG